MLLRSIKSLDFGSITLEVSRSEEDNTNVQRLGIVNASFVQSTSDVENMDKELEDLRIRIVASYDKKSSQLIDYITQRTNEYLINEKENSQFKREIPADKYIRSLRSDLRDEAYILNETQPFSPYSVEQTTVPQKFVNSFSSLDVLDGTIYYDIPLINTLKNSDGEFVVRRSVTNTDPARIVGYPETQLANQEWSEVLIRLSSRVSSQNLQRVYLEPVVFDFTGLTEGDLEQLTFYMFVYDSKFADPGQQFNLSQISLVTGMSFSRTANVIGERTFWSRMAPDNPFPTIGKLLPDGEYQDTRVLQAPEAELFQRIDLNPQNVMVERVNSMFDRVYGRLSRSILDSKPEINKVIKRDNFFSDLWVTKDSDENNRFMFAFDLESSLIANSYFPFLYRSPNISDQIINKRGLMDNPNSDPSRVLMMSVRRRSVDSDSQMPINELGTSGGKKILGPSYTFPEKVIGEANPVSDVYLNPDNTRSVENKTIFYEGKDSLTAPTKENPEKYESINTDVIYGVEYVVYDSAPIFMRNLVKFLTERKSLVTEIFDNIVNSVPSNTGYQGGVVNNGRDLYNPATLALNVPLSNIKGTLNERVQIYETALLNALSEYQQILDDLVPFEFEAGQINIREFYQNEFQKNGGLIDPLVIKDIEKLMDIGIQMIYRKLTEIFPNDPMGRGLDVSQVSNLQRRGFCQRKMPLVRGEHYFDTTKPEGESFGFGSDFVFTREPDLGNLDGLSRMSVDGYVERVNLEFEKYFQSLNNQASAVPVGSYRDPSYAYMTPRVIRTPDREEIRQTIAGGQTNPVVRYDLNRYGQLFSDIANIKYFAKNRQTNPTVIGRNFGQTENNELYDSVLNALEEQHGVEISFDIKPQYREPAIITGDTKPTVGEDFSRSSISIFRNGPLAIPSIIGGENNTNPSVITFIDSIEDTLSQTSAEKAEGSLDKDLTKKLQESRPIKLPFAILGELTVDKVLDFSTNYEDKEFNSLRQFTNITNITRDSLLSVVQDGILSALPNQVKSAIIISTTNQSLRFGTEDISFDACRPLLSDQDAGEEEHLVSFSINSPEEPPYLKTYDPMKIYAKFLTFWMNYKNIAVIEYLDSFGNLEANEDFYTETFQLGQIDEAIVDRTKLPVWRALTPIKIDDAIKSQKNLLCRVRMMSPTDYTNILNQYKEPTLELFRKYFEQKQEIEMPLYNKYFLLGLGEEPQEPPPPPPKKEQEEVEQRSETFGLVGAGYGG